MRPTATANTAAHATSTTACAAHIHRVRRHTPSRPSARDEVHHQPSSTRAATTGTSTAFSTNANPTTVAATAATA